MISTYLEYKRVGHLQNLPMPGGDLCAYNPYRMLISALTLTLSDEEIRDITKNHISQALVNGFEELEVILSEARVKNVIKTSSSGRFLDSVASLLGLTYLRTYEGEPAMRLESLGEGGNPNNIKKEPVISFDKEIRVLNTDNILNYLTINQNKLKKQDIAAFAQKYLAVGISSIALDTAKEEHIDTVAISGGVFVNRLISNTIVNNLKKGGLKVLVNEKVASGDGGSALGQSCIALASVI